MKNTEVEKPRKRSEKQNKRELKSDVKQSQGEYHFKMKKWKIISQGRGQILEEMEIKSIFTLLKKKREREVAGG